MREKISRHGPTTDDSPTISPELTEHEKRQLDCLLEEFLDILGNELGHTTLVEHGIHSSTAPPVKLQPYRLPQVYQELVKEELWAMEESGIINLPQAVGELRWSW